MAHGPRITYLSEAYRLANRLEDAIRLADQAVDFCHDQDNTDFGKHLHQLIRSK